MFQTAIWTKCLKPRHLASPALKMPITLCWTLSTSLSLPAFANIAKWLHNTNKCFIIKNYPPKPLCTSEPQASSVWPQLCFWQWDCPPPCVPQALPEPGDSLGDWGALLWKQWFVLKSKSSVQYHITWVSQKNICLLTRNWGFLIQSFSSQYFVAQWSTRTSYNKISYQPASGATGNQAQHQPHHSSCKPRVRGTGSFQFSMRTCGYFYISPS